MKKNYLYGLLSLFTLLFAASCQEEDVFGGAIANTDEVTFTVNTQQVATRASLAGQGSAANELYYGVYEATAVDADGNGTAWQLIPALSALTDDYKTAKNINVGNSPADITSNTVKVTIKFAKRKQYSVIFWAQSDAPMCTVDWGARTMSLKEDVVSNAEGNDVFWSYEPIKLTSAVSPTVNLYRPFAQLNIGTSTRDFDDAVAAETEVTQTKVSVKDMPTTMNLETGKVSGKRNVVYSYAAIPDTAAMLFPVPNHRYLALNYVLVDKEDKALYDITLSYKDDNDMEYTCEEFTGVPVQRNYRTNIYGSLLANSAEFSVKLESDLLTPDENIEIVEVGTAADLQSTINGMEEGDSLTIVLTDNIDLSDLSDLFGGSNAPATRAATTDPSLTIAEKKVLTIDLNGKMLSATSKQTGNNYNMFDVRGTLTVQNGTMEYKHKGDNMGWNNSTNLFNVTAGGVLNLNGITAKNLGGSDMGFVAHLNNWGKATLNVDNSTLESNYVAVRVFNSGNDMNNVTIKNSTLKGGNYAFWVHNYTVADFGTEEKAEAHKALLNFDIFNGTNEFIGKNNSPIRYGFTNSIYYDVYGNEFVANGVGKDSEGNYQIYSAEGLKWLATTEVTTVNLKLINDITIDADTTITIPDNKEIIFDLNGKTIAGITDDADKNDDGKLTSADNEVMFDVRGAMTVKNGTITIKHESDNFGWNACTEIFYVGFNGTLNVKDATLENYGGSDMAYAIDMVNADKNGNGITVNVENSTIKSSYIPVRVFNNGAGMNHVTIQNSTLEGTSRAFWVHIYSSEDNGGKGIKSATLDLNIFNPEANNTFIANNPYRLIEFGFDNEIQFDANGNQIVKTAEELAAALKAGGNYVLANDIALSEPIQVSDKEFTLNGNGYKIDQSSNYTTEGTAVAALLHPIRCTATIENIVFDGIKGDGPIRTVDTKLTIKNVTVQNCERTVTDATAQGLFRLHGESTVQDCTFKNNICPMAISINWDGNNDLPQSVTDCVFENNTCHRTAVLYYVKGSGCKISGNEFVSNTVTVTGSNNAATVYMGFTENNVITNNLFKNNTVNAGTSKRVSGGLMVGYAATITGNSFVGNTVNGENAKGNDVCASVYYTDIDLSGNYWGGGAPVEGDDYYKEYNNYEVIINDYLTVNPFQK